MPYRLTKANGESVTISDEVYEEVKGKLKSSTRVEKISDDRKEVSINKPHNERQKKYGSLGSVFPYLADDYDKNGEVKDVNGAIRRGIAGVKDVASYPGRAIAGLADYFVNGDNSLGKTSEEAMNKGQVMGGIIRDPLTFAIPGLKAGTSVGKAVLGGAGLGALDASISQEGYDNITPIEGAAIGAGFSALPLIPQSVINFLKKHFSKINKITMEEAKQLINGAMRGAGSKPLNDYETEQLIKAFPELSDKILRNANPKALKEMEEDAARELRNFANTPIQKDVSNNGAEIGFNEYLSRKKLNKTPTSGEERIIEEIQDAKEELELLKNGGNRKAINEQKQKIAELKQFEKAEKDLRYKNYANGEDQLRQAPEKSSQMAGTDFITKEFLNDFNSNLDDAITKMSSNWETVGGRLRRNSRGEIIPATPEQIGKRANEYVNMLSDKIQARRRALSKGIGEEKAAITNKDISIVLEKMAQRNEFEFMDALLDACSWLNQETKENLKRNAITQKAASGAKEMMDKGVKYLDENGNLSNVVLNKVPKKIGSIVRTVNSLANNSNAKFPKDFSKRYEAMQDGTAFRNYVNTLPDEVNTPMFAIPGLSIVRSNKE